MTKMKSVQVKGKGKKKSEKFGRIRDVNSIVSPDLSSLRKPIDTSASDLYQVCKLLENGTDEVKSVLSYECDIIYECRTCRSLFRSIINLISHKREYCKEKFDVTLHRGVLNNFHKESVLHLCETEQTIIKDAGVKNDRILRSQVPKEAPKKDLSTIIDMLNKKREEKENVESNLENATQKISNASYNEHIYLEPISTNCSAVYQTVESSGNSVELMKTQITELQEMIDQQVAFGEQILENHSEKSDSPIPADVNDEENELLAHRLSNTNNLSCLKCNAKFSTKKTLAVHMKTLHTSQRMCYPCPSCSNVFTNPWSVYRHLYKVHRKTNDQVRKLRPQIQEKAFHRETTAVEGSKNARASKVSVLKTALTKNDGATQGPTDHTESDVELQYCGRRRKRFRKAACLKMPAYDEINAGHEQSDKASSDSTSNDMLCETEDMDAITDIRESPSKENISDDKSERTSSSPEIVYEACTRAQTVSNCVEEDWDVREDPRNYQCNVVNNNNDPNTIKSSVKENVNNNELPLPDENQDLFALDKTLESPETVPVNLNETNDKSASVRNSRKRKLSSHEDEDEQQPTDSKEKDSIEVEEDHSRLQSSCSTQSSEKSPTSLMEERMAKIANFRKLQCLQCKRKFTSMPNLRRHMAIHIGWNRYRCTFCDFKCFTRCDCVVHCNKVHNAQTNHIIEEIVAEIPPSEYIYSEDMRDVTNTRAEMEEKVDVTEEKADAAEENRDAIEENLDDADITDADITDASTDQSKTIDLDNSGDSNISATSQNETDTTNERISLENETDTTNERISLENADVEHQSIDEDIKEDSDKSTSIDLSGYMMNSESGMHSDIKRMVMEVIFGSNATEQTDSDKPASEASDDAGGQVDVNDNEGDTASVDQFKEEPCPVLKHQRPTRNRMKPLSDDFIYDLKKMTIRKELFNSDSETMNVRKKAKLNK